MSIRSKLLFSFLSITLLILILFAVRQFFSVKEADLVKEIVLDHEISAQLSGLSSAAQKIRRYEKEYFIYVQTPKKRNKYAGEFADASSEISQYISRLKSIYSQTGKRNALAKLLEWERATNFYTTGFSKLNRQVQDGKIKGVIEANQAIQEYKNAFRVVLSGTAAEIKNQYQLATLKAQRIQQYQDTSSLVFIVIGILSLAVALIMSYQVPAGIVKPLKRLTDIANGISKGKVNESVDVRGSIEIEDLAKSINRLQAATVGLLKRVQAAKARN